MCVSEARVPVMTGLLSVFSCWICELGVFVCSRSHVWRGIINYMISKINPGFGHSKLIAGGKTSTMFPHSRLVKLAAEPVIRLKIMIR